MEWRGVGKFVITALQQFNVRAEIFRTGQDVTDLAWIKRFPRCKANGWTAGATRPKQVRSLEEARSRSTGLADGKGDGQKVFGVEHAL